MTTPVILAVLAAALLHAAWNAIAHAITDRLLGFALISLGGMLATLPLLLFTGLPPREAWPPLLGSLALHLLYMGLLMLAYRAGEFGQVYPLARGTAPWVVALLAVPVFGETLPPPHLAGVLTVSLGLMALVLAGGCPRRRQLPALASAFATGLAIAGYTLVDGYGVRLTENPVGYLAWIMMLQGPVFLLVAACTRRGRLAAQLRPIWRVGLLGGGMSAAAYGLVLWAQLSGALAGIAALRETSIVFAAIMGGVLFGERLGRTRVMAAATVAAGAVLLAL